MTVSSATIPRSFFMVVLLFPGIRGARAATAGFGWGSCTPTETPPTSFEQHPRARGALVARVVVVAVAALLVHRAAGVDALREGGLAGAEQCEPEGNHAHNLLHDHLHLSNASALARQVCRNLRNRHRGYGTAKSPALAHNCSL